MNAVVNYCLNKFFPYVIIILLLFVELDASSWHPYVILGCILFIDKFSHKTGYAVAYCESHGIDPLSDD